MACTISGPTAKLPADTKKNPRNATYEFPEAIRRHVAERPSRLFRHNQAQAAEAAERRAHGGVDYHQCRGMGPDPDHAAYRAHTAGRRLADAGHPELVLARIRQPCRFLAPAAGL